MSAAGWLWARHQLRRQWDQVVVLANGLAFWPGRRAARRRSAEVLRTE